MNRVASGRSNPSHVKRSDIANANTISDITDLPHEVFLLIIYYLSPTEGVLCRRVSRTWRAVFTSDDVSWNLMRCHFPRVREMRNAAGDLDRSAWAHIFPKVARRYFYLRSATPRVIETISQWQGNGFCPVPDWDRWLEWNSNLASLQVRNPNWCLDDGLLIYRDVSGDYVAYDLETSRCFSVPFNPSGKIVRRLRLAHGILVIEWYKPEENPIPYVTSFIEQFATAFDVRQSTEAESADLPGSWDIQFRSEWRLHHDPFPYTDRFFSAHTATHYALYLWQEDGAPPGEVLVEQLTVWDIRCASPYRPSEDSGPTQPGPKIIKMFKKDDLEFLNIRQGRRPMFHDIWLDEANVYIHDESHRWLMGPQAPINLPRCHYVRATGIPFSGIGPRWFDECGADGNVHMNFCPRAGSAAHRGPIDTYRFDNAWPGWAPCWRHEEFPYLTVSDMVDAQACVRIVARQCFGMETLSSYVLPSISSRAEADLEGVFDHEVRFADDLWWQLAAGGHIMGDERWVVGENQNGGITIMRF
ncbi:hypothetical protein F5B22DRAFT_269745 [Xylaria bambusicola]|uniref:uncharacterized protein n=1 Tax=Xylaria bambusicola TaxID=326684 RepID=UPI002007F650|nr:uncharacterized protein F5B22DRAFT_269745 [Xylaria bambusicola]KAI0526128.1 hypothetical protein F5B22DRAFT_269745 [Xylaria bambusicola]